MLDKQTIIKRLKDGVADQGIRKIELVCIQTTTALSRFAENLIHQNIEQSDHKIIARVALRDRVGLAVSNDIEPMAIKNLIQSAIEIAENQKPDPDYPGVVHSPKAADRPGAFAVATADLTPGDRATAIRKAVTACTTAGLSAAGLYKSVTKASTVVNSAGTVQYFPETFAEFSLTASDDAASGSGWGTAYHRDAAQLDVAGVISTAVDKAVRSRNPQPLPPGEYTVILEPAAVGQLLLFLGFLGFSGKSFAAGRSFMARQIGEQITGKNITIIDDAAAPEMAGMPFDYEGVPRQRVMIIENGIARGVTFDRREAKKAGKESTGHALPPDNGFGPYPKNLAIKAGTTPFKELISSTAQGVLITHFWYINYLNPRRTQVTATTLDGTFAIKDGKLDHPITNMRATPPLLEMFANVEAIARERVIYPQYSSVMLVPGMKINNFSLSEDTENG